MKADDDCFCELAALYALNVLEEQESRLVEEQIAQCPDLAAELAEFQTAVAAIPYSSPPVTMAEDLKDRLFQRLGLETPSEEPATVTRSRPMIIPHIAVKSQDIVWQPHPVPGVAIATLHVDPVNREMVGLLKAAAGVHYPLHRHAGVEEIFMVEGDLVIGEEVYSSGDYIRSSPGSVHAPETRGGCMFFFRTSLDDEYSDSSGF